MALVSVELETLVFEPDAQTTRPPMELLQFLFICMKLEKFGKKASQLHFKLHTRKKRKHTRALNIVS